MAKIRKIKYSARELLDKVEELHKLYRYIPDNRRDWYGTILEDVELLLQPRENPTASDLKYAATRINELESMVPYDAITRLNRSRNRLPKTRKVAVLRSLKDDRGNTLFRKR